MLLCTLFLDGLFIEDLNIQVYIYSIQVLFHSRFKILREFYFYPIIMLTLCKES